MNRLPIIILTLLAVLASNPDMFIEPLTVSESKLVMPFTGGTVEDMPNSSTMEMEIHISYPFQSQVIYVYM